MKLSAILPTHWKNKKGITRQYDIFPPGASLQDAQFLWRLSSAHIQESSPFSLFPGYNRLLIVWQGEGLILNTIPLFPHAPHSFSGETVINCQLIDGKVIDLGMIYNREKIRAKLEVITMNQGDFPLPIESNLCFYFFAKGDDFKFNHQNIQPGDILKIQNEKRLSLKLNSPSLFYRISLEDI